MILLNDPRQNRGTAFTTAERRFLGLEGLLPSRVETFSDQKKRIEYQIDEKQNDLERYIYLQGLLEKNETLFYSILASDPQRYVPIIYAPTLAAVCQQFSQIYRRPHGMYITIEMKGRIAEVLRNWPERDIRTICVTTGGRILGLGDIGANGMGIPIGKLQIYTACGAVPPAALLPIQLDIGTTNAALHEDPFYLGLRRMPPAKEELDEFVEEFMNAVQEVFPGCCVHFEDWKGTDALRYLAKYKDRSLCYNDDIQGTAAVTLAGILTALRISRQPLQEQRILFFGAGASALGCADLLVSAFMNEGLSEEEACSRLVMMDIDGLICKSRTDLLEEQRRYALDGPSECSLIEVIRKIRPTILIGVSHCWRYVYTSSYRGNVQKH
jgi:malate dehydrogenase (oxaloacetate-decarboxylating)(NADP+)